MNGNAEATFPVNETDNPLRIELESRPFSFLLIVPTRHIVTGHSSQATPGVRQLPVVRDTRDIPAYSQVF